MADRVRGITVHRPIIYGNFSVMLTATERGAAPQGHTHRWTVAVRSAASAPEGNQTGGADDLSYMIKKVTFKLHDTYTQPNRVIEKPPFEVTETGWGEFDIPIRIHFVSEAIEKPINILHHLKLHPWLQPPSEDPTSSAVAPTLPMDPINSWQYDEIVFSEPPSAFYNILKENPPTPLPKLKKRAVPPNIAHHASLSAATRGTPEFTAIMEKEESERLESVRKAIVTQTDVLRAELIDKEKERDRLKARVEAEL